MQARAAWRLLFAAGAALLFGLLGGCAVQTAALSAAFPPDLPPQAELTEVPFFPQPERYLCGPESLAAALHAAGIAAMPQDLKPEVYLPGREGSLQIEMLAAARRNGAVAMTLKPRLEAVLREVANGTPVLVLMNLSLPIAPLWHYAVVVGYDASRQIVILRSGPEKRQLLPWSTFEHVWARSNYWSMVALQPGRVPLDADVDENEAVQALIAFERVAPPARARDAYTGALVRWPHNLTLRMGLGNTLYANGQKREAAQAFTQAARAHETYAAAWLNLAQTEADLGHRIAAQDAARRVVALGGPHADAARALLQSLGAAAQ